MGGEPPGMARSKRRLLFLICPLAVSGVVLSAVWTRGPQLEWYTSPRIVVHGRALRMKALMPVGWVAEAPNIWPMPGDVPVGYTGRAVVIRPHETLPWLPDWLRRYFYRRTDDLSLIVLSTDPSPRPHLRVEPVMDAGSKTPSAWAIHRSADSDPVCSVVFFSRDRATAETLGRSICGSFQVVR